MKRIAIAGVLLLAALAGWAGWHYSDAPRAIVAKVLEYFRGPTLPPGFASGNGRIEATEYDITTKRPTRIIAVLVKEGDLVEPGQVVVRMDTADLGADLRTTEAQLGQAREDKRRAVATVGGCLLTVSFYGAERVVEHYNLMGPVKAALESVVLYMAAELGPKRIRVHAISPGPLKTRAASGIDRFEELLERVASRAPPHDLVTIDDVGAVAACLVSDAARAMTGDIAYVDGGYHIVG